MEASFAETSSAGSVLLCETGKAQTIRLAIGADGLGAVVFLSVSEAVALKNLIERAIVRALGGVKG